MASTFYEVLGVPRYASDADIKKAFKELAKKYHPDKHPGEKFYEDHFKKINEAYQTLSNPQSRQRYDLRINYTQYTPPPHQQNKQAGNQQRSNPNRQTAYTNYKKPQANRPTATQKKINKLYIYTGVGAVLFIVACAWFYNFMNAYASNEYYIEGLKAEQKGNTAEAMDYFYSSLEKDMDNPKSNEQMGDIFTKLAQNNSIELFYFDLELQKKNVDASVDEESADLYKKMRAIDSLAALYYNRSFENYETDADKRRVGLKQIRTELKIGNFREAMVAASQISSYKDSKHDDSVLYYQAEINFQMKNYAEARRQYTAFYAMHPNSSDALIRTALCHYNESNEDFALSQLNKAIARFPEKGEAYYFKGEIARRNNDSISACALFYKADSLNVLAAKPAIYKYCEN